MKSASKTKYRTWRAGSLRFIVTTNALTDGERAIQRQTIAAQGLVTLLSNSIGVPGRTVFSIALIVALLSPSTAQSATAPTTGLTVHVVDESGKPIWLAQVSIYGPKNLAAESTRSGDAIFPTAPAGTYRLRVMHFGYSVIDTKVTVVGAVASAVTARMARLRLKQIATVAVKATPKPASKQVTSDSTSVQLGDSLIAGVSSLPGVAVNPNGQASIGGYSPNQTTLSINGVPVSLPGTAQSLNILNADVFANASVAPGSGGGGTIGFQTRSPTLAWQGVARAVLASNNGEDLAFQEEGTAGDIGISYSHAHNVLSDPLDGKSYLDTSGLFYSHDTSAAVNADALQLRYEFSLANTLLATVVALDSFIPITCKTWTGIVPCGYGPNNVQREKLHTIQLKDFAQFGESTANVTVYANRIVSDVDQSGYYVGGVSEPSSSESDSHQSGAIASLDLVAGKITLPLSISSSATTTNAFGSAFGPLLPPTISRYSQIDASLPLTILRRPRARASLNLGIESESSEGYRTTSTQGSFLAQYAVGQHDEFSTSYSPGNLAPPTAAYDAVSSPALLQFICGPHIGIGVGPTTAGEKVGTQTAASLDWSHDATYWGSDVSIYRNVQYNEPISATVSALALDPTLFAPGYLAQAQQGEQSACGGSPAIGLNDLFFAVSGVADRAIYSGVNVSVHASLGRRASLNVSYATTLARAYGTNSLIFGPLSTVIAGAQLPNVAMHAASAGANISVGSSVSALFQASYQSANNAGNLPAHTTFDTGVLVKAPRGLLSVTMTNIGNEYPGPFASAVGAVPLPMNGGAFPTIGQPLAPRTLRVGYRFAVGLPERQTTFDIPNEQFQTPTFGWRVSTGSSLRSETGVPRDPFAIDRQSVYCGPKDVRSAEAILKTWASYAQRIEDAKTNGVYPASFPPLVDDQIVLHYQPNGASYVILISIANEATNVTSSQPAASSVRGFFGQMQPFFNCAIVHSADEADLKERHLYEAPVLPNDFTHMFPKYAPEVGFYDQPFTFISKMQAQGGAPALPTADNLTYRGVEPPMPVGQPFALKDWSNCSAEIRPAAQELLGVLAQYAHSYYDLKQRPASPDGLLITPHTEESGKTWLEIRAQDNSALYTLRQCIYTTIRIRATVERAGLDGVPSPELNYAPSLGLYQVF